MEQGCIDEAVGIAIATRPDCIADEYLDILADIRDRFQKDIYIELGLQTVNYDTLEKINRGHDLAQFIDAVLRIKRYGFNITTHMIVNLPWDSMKDTIEGARILSALGVDQVKLHALYIVKNTLMAKWYQEGQFTLISAEEYADRVVNFVRHLHPDIVLQRLVGRAPEDNTLFTNWSMGWWRVQDLIDDNMNTFLMSYIGYPNAKIPFHMHEPQEIIGLSITPAGYWGAWNLDYSKVELLGGDEPDNLTRIGIATCTTGMPSDHTPWEIAFYSPIKVRYLTVHVLDNFSNGGSINALCAEIRLYR